MTAIINTYNKNVIYYDYHYSNIMTFARLYKGELNSYNDEPAIVYQNGDKSWYKDGELHRDNDLPAVEWIDGTKIYYKNGNRHRDNNKPAVIYSDVYSPHQLEYWINGIKIK